MQKLKDENNVLSRKVKELDDRLYNIKRSGCGPGCGKNASSVSSSSSSSAKEGETSTTSVSAPSSCAGSQHSMSPNKSARNGGSNGDGVGGGDGVGSAGKTYNLRRRPKVAVEAVAGAGGVNTRGRRAGLRDMTNGN